MKISIDDQEIFTFSEVQKKVIQDQIPTEMFEEDMKRRIKWVLIDEKYKRCMKKLRDEWTPRFTQEGIEFIPTNEDSFAEMVFAHPDYKSRSQMDALKNNLIE